jgi:LacI family transcriptional regulator
MRKTSLQDIADRTGLSRTTISWILNDKGHQKNISQKTIDMVTGVARQMNYFPNYIAKSLSLGRSNTLGLIVPRITDSYFAQIAATLEKQGEEHGYTVIYGSAEEDPVRERKLINTLMGKQVDGLIVASSLRNESEIGSLVERSFPLVLIDRYYPGIDTNYVVVEDERGAYDLVSGFTRAGRRRIGMITVSPWLLPIRDRESGYLRALEAAGLPVDRSLIREVQTRNADTSVYKAVKELVCAPEPADAIFFVTHYLAANGVKSIRMLGRSIPDDVAICCFGDSPYLKLLDPPVTAVPMPSAQIADEALRILLRQIDGEQLSPEHVVLPVKVCTRKSL